MPSFAKRRKNEPSQLRWWSAKASDALLVFPAAMALNALATSVLCQDATMLKPAKAIRARNEMQVPKSSIPSAIFASWAITASPFVAVRLLVEAKCVGLRRTSALSFV